MTPAILNAQPFPFANDMAGNPLNLGYLYIGTAGLDPLLFPKSVYWDAAGIFPIAQPLRTINGRVYNNGAPAAVYVTGDYSLRELDANGAQITFALNANPIGGPSGSDMVGFTAAGSTQLRTAQEKLREWVSVLDFMTAAQRADVLAYTFTQDVTAACQLAIDNTGGACAVYFPAGGYVLDALKIKQSGTRLFGAGKRVSILRGKAASNFILQTNNLGSGSGVGVIQDVTIEGFKLEVVNMVISPNSTAIYLWNCYNNRLSDLLFDAYQTQTVIGSLYLGQGVYETYVTDVHGGNLYCVSPNTDRCTTATFVGTSWSFVNISKALGITFLQPVVQGDAAVGYPVNKIQIADSYNVSFIGGDFEAGPTNVLFSIANSFGVLSLNNNLDSTASPQVWPGTYYLDGGGNRQISLMDTFSYRDRQTFVPVAPGVPTYTVQSGNYRRIGDRVEGEINFTYTLATPGGAMVITGLPATSKTGVDTPVALQCTGLVPGANVVLHGFIPSNSTQINIAGYNTTTGAATGVVQVAAATVNIKFGYETATY